MEQTINLTKQPYAQPVLKRYGKVGDLTQTLNSGGRKDGASSSPGYPNNKTH